MPGQPHLSVDEVHDYVDALDRKMRAALPGHRPDRRPRRAFARMSENFDVPASLPPFAMLAGLLRARRFAGLFWCQFFSVFNDNFVRNMLAMLILFRLGETEAGPLITLAVGTFMVPSLLLSGLGGEMADAHDKAWLARRLKFAEILVQMIAAAGLFLSSLPLLYTALFGLGVISALFGPVKYGILPDLLAKTELMAGNALVEAATFIAIFLGLIAGGLSAKGRGPEGTVLQLDGDRHRLFRGQSFYSVRPGARGAGVFAPTAMSWPPPSRLFATWRRSQPSGQGPWRSPGSG